jgi:hypothetical protein
MPPTTDPPPVSDITLDRLEDQLAWYDRKSSYNQKAFKRLKVCTIAAAALVPVMATTYPLVTAGLGILIAVIEGVQQVYQFHSNWTVYRSTSEALKREKYLYLAHAGDYGTAQDPKVLLAERVEALVAAEHAKWSEQVKKVVQPPAPPAEEKK